VSVSELGTDPLDADSDDDGLSDGAEVDLGTYPLDADSDHDGLPDGAEVELGTDPLNADSDHDGLSDGAEVELGTDPLDADSDGDGILDGAEVEAGTDPLSRTTGNDDQQPTAPDTPPPGTVPDTPPPGQATDTPPPGTAPDSSSPAVATDLPPETAPVPRPAAVSRFGVSFRSVVVRLGATANVPVEVYQAAGTVLGKARVTWKSASPKTASVVKGRKSGSLSWSVGKAANLKIRADRIGSTTIQVVAPGARKLTILVRVVPKDRSVGVEQLAIAAKRSTVANSSTGLTAALKSASSPVRVHEGQSVTLKAWVYPLGASRSQAEWRSSRPGVALVDDVGRVTAAAKGRTTITCEVAGKKAHKTVIVE
jgi:hypothetical protein